MKILVIADSTTDKPERAFYPLLAGLCRRVYVDGVYVVDRALPQNADFFVGRHADYIYVRQADADYSADNQESYRPVPFHVEDADAVWVSSDVTDEAFLIRARSLFRGRLIDGPDALLPPVVAPRRAA